MKHIQVIFVFIVGCIVLGYDAQGATLNVGPGQQYTSIESAVDAASDGDVINLAAGTYVENIIIDGKSVYLRGGWNADFTERDWETHVTVIDGNQAGSCIVWSDSEDGELSGFILTNGYAFGTSQERYGGGMYAENSSPTIAHCTFSSSSAQFQGGGIHSENSNLLITYCTFSDNLAYYGAGVSNVDGSLEVSNSTFSGNSAREGGGIINRYGSLSVSGCTFSGNSASGEGGGICNLFGNIMVSNCMFRGNQISSGGPGTNYAGGGIYNKDSSSSVISNCSFSDNSSVNYGGGIYNLDSPTTIAYCTFAGNSAGRDGGGLSNSGSNATIRNCIFIGNSADDSGGGIYNGNSIPTITNSILWGNSARWSSQVRATTAPPTPITYCNIQGGWPGEGVIDADPLFADPENGDFHLRSPFGRWDSAVEDWVFDEVFSPCISTGDPTSDFSNEPEPNGGRINMGAHGNTQYASKDARIDLTLTVNSTPITDVVITGVKGGTTNYTIACKEYDRIALLTEITAYVGEIRYVLDGWSIDGLEAEAQLEGNQSSIEFVMYEDTDVSLTYVYGGPIWYVRADEQDGDGSIEAPFGSIQQAIGSAKHNDAINVAAGTYVEKILIHAKAVFLRGGWNDEFTERDLEQYVTTIDGAQSSSCVRWTYSDGGELSGMHLINGAAQHGGGMYNRNSTPAVTSCTFSSNAATENGGGMYNANSTPVLSACTFSGNSAVGDGGAIYNTNSSSEISDCTLVGNNAGGAGAGLYNIYSGPAVIGCTFSDNHAAWENGGGGIGNSYSNPIITGCTFSGNSADWEGGAISNWYGSSTITNCSFSGNEADYHGGGISNWESDSTITNSLFSHNQSKTVGGGIYNQAGSHTIANTTFSENSANHFGAMYNRDSSLWLTNSIVWNNGENQIRSGSQFTITYSNIQGGWEGESNIDADPFFADPDNNDFHLKSQYGRWSRSTNDSEGGWVYDDTTSPCIGAGNPASDYSNEPQPNGGRINMGAYGNTPYASKLEFTRFLIDGDATFDCTVNEIDLIFVRNRLGVNVNHEDNSRADVNEDGVINILDLASVRNRLGDTCPTPEHQPLAAMTLVPAGTFTTSTNVEVYLNSYYMDIYEVTNTLYCQFLNSGDNDAHWRDEMSNEILRISSAGKHTYAVVPGMGQRPVRWVTWHDAVAFCDWRSEAEELPQGTYHLPTQAQWEKAAGWDPEAGVLWTYGFTGSDAIGCSNANFTPDSGACIGTTSDVGSYHHARSYYGLFDASGNVWEFCADWLGPYPSGTWNPTGPSSGTRKTARGGSWYDTAGNCRVRIVYAIEPMNWDSRVGFRCATALD